MCGIFGYKNLDINIEKIHAELYHRGPDSFNISRFSDWTFCHSRLSIIDLSPNAIQPMEYKGNILVFNGEIYNYLELKKEFLNNEFFTSSSDTEVLLKLLFKYGMSILNKLNGIFAFAYYDSCTNSVYLIRDRFGVKPLYFYMKDKVFAFSSEDKALKNLLNIPFDLNEEYVKNLFDKNMSDFNENTLIKDIYSVNAGEYIEITSENKIIKNKYYNFNDYDFENINKYGFQENLDYFENLLTDAISLRNRSDCPIAMTLSSGIDSTVIYTLAKEKIGCNYTIFTYSNEGRLDEYKNAARLAKEYGDKIIKIEYDKEHSYENYEKSLIALNGPIWSSAHVGYYDVYKKIKEQGFKVVIEGHGSDEIFGGWQFLFPIAIKQSFANKNYLLALNILNLYLTTNKITLYKKNILDVIEYIKNLTSNDKSVFDRTLEYIFTKKILPINLRCWDRVQMANSIESRSPFLDYRIVEYVRALPLKYKINSIGNKAILRHILKKYKKDFIYKNKVKQPFLASEIEFLTQNSKKMLQFYDKTKYKFDISNWENNDFSKGYNPQIYKACALGFLENHYKL